MSLDLDAIKARVDAALRGPWYTDGYGNVVAEQGDLLSDTPDAELTAEFIAHAREDIPALLAEVERLRAWGPDQTTDRERAGIAEENLSAALMQRDEAMAEVERLHAVEARVRALAVELVADERWCSSGDILRALDGSAS